MASIPFSAIKARGYIKVGTTGDYAPQSWLNPATGSYEGFDTELTEDLVKALGVEIQYVPTSWPGLMKDTLENKFDLAICGITITQARKDQALMSIGYLGNGKTILIRAEDTDKYKSLADINKPEVKVIENPGGLNEKFARENLPLATLIIHSPNDEIPSLIADGQADVMITEILEAGYYVRKDSRLAVPLIHSPFNHGELGVLMPKALHVAITTAGTDRNSICYELHCKAQDILAGRKIDPTFYPVVYSLPDDADWSDEKSWYKVNPSLGYTVPIERMREAFLQAQENPAEENVFRQLRLCQWVGSSVAWIPEHVYNKGNVPINADSLIGRDCYCGLDLSSTSDITAFCMVFPPMYDGDKYIVLPHFWLPREATPDFCDKK